MPFLGTIINFIAVLLMGTVGSLIKRGIPKKISKAVIYAMATAVIYIGIDGFLAAPPEIKNVTLLSSGLLKVIIIVLSMGAGAVIGEIIDLDAAFNKLGLWVEKKFNNGINQNISTGFVSCSLIFCVGAMAVNGAIDDALGKPEILIAKAVIDGITCFVMATGLGFGCALSAFVLLVYQGSITVIALFLSSFIPQTAIDYISIVGSLIIMLIGTNMLEITKVKTTNLIPAMFMPIILIPLFGWIL